jgi:hypothetical protein
MRQVALASSFYVDTAGIAASGLGGACASDPMQCLQFLRPRPGGLPISSPVVTGNLDAICMSPASYEPVVAEFLTGFASEGDAIAAAAAISPSDVTHGGGVAAVLVLPATLDSDNMVYTLRTNATDVPNAAMLHKTWAKQVRLTQHCCESC